MKIEGKIGIYMPKIKKIMKICEKVLKEDFSKVYFSVNFVDENTIQSLNSQFRQINKVTDVLSFPNLAKTSSEKLKKYEKYCDFDTGLLFLGDIVICKSVAKAQAKEFGHSLKREICFLTLHGFLHLLGFDHIKVEEEKIMNKLQDKIINEAKL